jgi:hypothetical protein
MANAWRVRAKCSGLSVIESEELFFPLKGRSIKKAKEFCNNGCKVVEQCLNFALENDARGIWAGLTYKERKAIQDFRKELDSPKPSNPRANRKKVKRSNFKVT